MKSDHRPQEGYAALLRRVRRLEALLAIAVVALIGLATTAATQRGGVLVGSALQIVDSNGQTRCFVGTKEGQTTLGLTDENGAIVVRLIASPEATVIDVGDGDSFTRMFAKDGVTGLLAGDDRSVRASLMFQRQNGKADLILSGDNGEGRAALVCYDNVGGLITLGADGEVSGEEGDPPILIPSAPNIPIIQPVPVKRRR